MDFVGKIVIHKTLGRGVVSRQNAEYFIVSFDQEEKTFSYVKSFGFLRFEDASLNEEIQRLIQIKEEEKRKERALWRPATVVESTRANTTKLKQKRAVKNNIVFKCNYCDGGRDKMHLGFMGACSDKMIQYNIEKAKHKWCSDPECPCNQYYHGEIDGTELDQLCACGDSTCYESVMLLNWEAFAGSYLTGDKKYTPKKINNVQIGSLAILTTRLPNETEEDRIVFGVFLVDEGKEGNGVETGFVRSTSKYRMELHPAEAKRIKFWKYHANGTNSTKAFWGTGLYRYTNDIEAAQILRDIVKVKTNASEKKFAEEFFEYFCRIKGIKTGEIPEPDGMLVGFRKNLL